MTETTYATLSRVLDIDDGGTSMYPNAAHDTHVHVSGVIQKFEHFVGVCVTAWNKTKAADGDTAHSFVLMQGQGRPRKVTRDTYAEDEVWCILGIIPRDLRELSSVAMVSVTVCVTWPNM